MRLQLTCESRNVQIHDRYGTVVDDILLTAGGQVNVHRQHVITFENSETEIQEPKFLDRNL